MSTVSYLDEEIKENDYTQVIFSADDLNASSLSREDIEAAILNTNLALPEKNMNYTLYDKKNAMIDIRYNLERDSYNFSSFEEAK